MKQLQLELKERLLILEGEFMLYYNERPLKLICKGDELTEEVAKGLIKQEGGYLFDGDQTQYISYPDFKYKDHPFEGKSFKTALESFISAIESKGYFWKTWNGVNATFAEQEACTFNPSRTLIFKIS